MAAIGSLSRLAVLKANFRSNTPPKSAYFLCFRAKNLFIPISREGLEPPPHPLWTPIYPQVLRARILLLNVYLSMRVTVKLDFKVPYTYRKQKHIATHWSLYPLQGKVDDRNSTLASFTRQNLKNNL